MPEIKAAVEAAGLDWAKFQRTDNSCPLHPPQKAPLEELADDIQGVSGCGKPLSSLHVSSVNQPQPCNFPLWRADRRR